MTAPLRVRITLLHVARGFVYYRIGDSARVHRCPLLDRQFIAGHYRLAPRVLDAWVAELTRFLPPPS